MVHLTIDNRKLEVSKAPPSSKQRSIGIHIPTLCAHIELGHTPGACRVCLVRERSRTLIASALSCGRGMKVKTSSERVRQARLNVMEFLLSDHPQTATSVRNMGTVNSGRWELVACVRSGTADRFTTHRIDQSSPRSFGMAQCINRLRCVAVCSEVQGQPPDP
jgi:NADH dehydrogenase/NADH:ubiquinone oxidoreductase subunit G